MRSSDLAVATLAACCFLVSPGSTAKSALRITPDIAIESRIFSDEPQFEPQFDGVQAGIILGGDLRWRSADRRHRVRVEPYVRLDSQDRQRTYADLREASWSTRDGLWEYEAGIGQVFWGVAESRNVVDIINQFDTVEDSDQGEKLGQPMVRVGRRVSSGRLDAYYLPYFRQQRLSGSKGRLRVDPVVETGNPDFDRNGDEWAGDVALRYTARTDRIDVGLHGFYGTSREALFIPDADTNRFTTRYQERYQAGVDLQFTEGPWLLKGEAVAANVSGDTFLSSVYGFEYTFFGVSGSSADVGVIIEHLYDDRDAIRSPLTLFQDDVFLGLRITPNDMQDTEILAGGFVDTDSGAIIASAEYTRRLGTTLLLELEARYFDDNGGQLVRFLDQDSNLLIRLTKYF
ncbi:MAG: hypothetical protein AAGI24_00520 [Pseudomonadota bacterium]